MTDARRLLTTHARRSLRWIRHIVVSAQPESPVFGHVSAAFIQARLVVKIYYFASIYFTAMTLPPLHKFALETGSWDFLWPVRWLSGVDASGMVDWIGLASVAASLLAFQFPGSRCARLLFALASLQVASVANSHGGINHGYHAWFWISLFLVFLPSVPAAGEPSRPVKMAYLSVVGACQMLLLGFYSLAGLWKVQGGITAVLNGTPGNFSPEGLALTLADRILATGTSPLLADIVIDRLWLSQPLFLALIYIQFVALVVAFRPRLHAAWGYFIIAFHIGTWVLMEIIFTHHIALLALFLVYSPFRPARWSLRDAVADLPLLGWLARLLPRPVRAPVLKPELPATQKAQG